MDFSLDSAPPGVLDESLWRTGEPGIPSVGDLWLLSWDGEALGLALIAGVGDGYVLVWPVTLPSELAFLPSVVVSHSPLGCPVYIWPSRETGVGAHMLHRRYGDLLREPVMADIADAIEQGREGPLPYADAIDRNADVDAADDAMVDRWESICLNIWPAAKAGTAPLNREALRANQLRPSDIAAALRLTASDAVALFNGEQMPDPAQIEALESRFGLSVEELMAPHMDEGARELLSPAWKDSILRIARHLQIHESEARDSLREEYALAARSGGPRADRMRAAVQRLLERRPA